MCVLDVDDDNGCVGVRTQFKFLCADDIMMEGFGLERSEDGSFFGYNDSGEFCLCACVRLLR